MNSFKMQIAAAAARNYIYLGVKWGWNFKCRGCRFIAPSYINHQRREVGWCVHPRLFAWGSCRVEEWVELQPTRKTNIQASNSTNKLSLKEYKLFDEFLFTCLSFIGKTTPPHEEAVLTEVLIIYTSSLYVCPFFVGMRMLFLSLCISGKVWRLVTFNEASAPSPDCH